MQRLVSRSFVLVLTLALSIPGAPLRAQAQDAPADLARDLAALRQEVERLRRELDALKSSPTPEKAAPERAGAEQPTAAEPSTTAALEVVNAQLAELAQVKVESESRMPVRIFGVIHTHLFANSGSGNWLESPNLVDGPLPDGGGARSAARSGRRVSVSRSMARRSDRRARAAWWRWTSSAACPASRPVR